MNVGLPTKAVWLEEKGLKENQAELLHPLLA